MSLAREDDEYEEESKQVANAFDRLPSINPNKIIENPYKIIENSYDVEIDYQNEEDGSEKEEDDDNEVDNEVENEVEENEFENEVEYGFVDEIGARDRAGGENVVRDKKYYASRTEKEIFLDSIAIELKKYYNENYQKGDLFDILSDLHPHPRFLNPLLCISVSKFFYVGSNYTYTHDLYERYKIEKRGPLLLPYDLIRYTSLFSRYLSKK